MTTKQEIAGVLAEVFGAAADEAEADYRKATLMFPRANKKSVQAIVIHLRYVANAAAKIAEKC